MMSDWDSRIDLGIKAQDGTTINMVSAPYFRGLAMVPASVDRWSLTHVRSGLRVIFVSGPRDNAFQAAGDIARLVAWEDFATAADLVAANPNLVAQIKAMVRSMEGLDEMEAGHA